MEGISFTVNGQSAAVDPSHPHLLSALREELGFEGDIEMDGGIGPKTIGACAEAGANIMVAGSAIYGTDDPAAALRSLRDTAEGARRNHR